MAVLLGLSRGCEVKSPSVAGARDCAMRIVCGGASKNSDWFYSYRLRASKDHIEGAEVFVGRFYFIRSMKRSIK